MNDLVINVLIRKAKHIGRQASRVLEDKIGALEVIVKNSEDTIKDSEDTIKESEDKIKD